MRYQTYPPPRPLAHVVRFYWVYEMDGIDGQPYVYRSLASGLAEMVFHYRGPFVEVGPHTNAPDSRSMLHAQTARSRRFETKENFSIFGAYLYPDALPLITGYAARSLTDELPDLVALWGAKARVLEAEMMEATDDHARCGILSAFFLNRLSDAHEGDLRTRAAIRNAINAQGQTTVTALSDAFNLSPRQLERQFQTYAGFSPKRFLRILRFQSAVECYGDRQRTLTDIALACGYYDQAHFIHDFKAFSGYTPGEFFRGSPEGRDFCT
jgi:AraC-like DNA-binding protein